MRGLFTMKFLTTTAIAVLLMGGLSAFALAPSANADDATTAAPAVAVPTPPATDLSARGDGGPRMGRPGATGGGMMGRPGHMNGMGTGRPGGLLDIACGDRGAEALEIALVHVNYAVKPTADQAPLLDALKTAALADQKTFADACQTARSSDSADAGLLGKLQTRLAIDKAHVTALADVMPKFKAFYDSLTAEQKAKLEPRQGGSARAGIGGGMRGSAPWGQHGWSHGGPGKMQPADNSAPGAATPGDQDSDGSDGLS
jgi:hypothetical protein